MQLEGNFGFIFWESSVLSGSFSWSRDKNVKLPAVHLGIGGIVHVLHFKNNMKYKPSSNDGNVL